MKARLRVISAAVAIATGFAVPALAQDAQAPAADASPAASQPSSEAVGPAQLRDFSLQGTVTRQAEPTVESKSRPSPASSPTASDQVRSAAPGPATEGPARAAVRPVPAPPTSASQSARIAATSTGLPSPDQTLRFSPATMASAAPKVFDPAPLPGSHPDGETGSLSYWPWILVMLAAAGAAAWYFRRWRPGHAYAGANGNASSFDFPTPPAAPAPERALLRPSPAPATPVPSPPSRPHLPERAASGAVVSTRLRVASEVRPEPKLAPAPVPGIVSARLRPWLDIEFVPLTASFDDRQGVIQFDVTLFNSGSAPAREILLEARLFNAGEDQDEAIEKFFDNPTVSGEGLELVEPLRRLAFRTSATVPRDQMRVFEAGGRKVWVPLIGFNASYRWGGGDGQTSASYLLGRGSTGGKMAPFRIDLGARTFDGLDAREHNVRVRR